MKMADSLYFTIVYLFVFFLKCDTLSVMLSSFLHLQYECHWCWLTILKDANGKLFLIQHE